MFGFKKVLTEKFYKKILQGRFVGQKHDYVEYVCIGDNTLDLYILHINGENNAFHSS